MFGVLYLFYNMEPSLLGKHKQHSPISILSAFLCVTGNICCSYFLYLVRLHPNTDTHTPRTLSDLSIFVSTSRLHHSFHSLPRLSICSLIYWVVLGGKLKHRVFVTLCCASITSIHTATDAFWWGAFKSGRRSVYEGAGQTGLSLGSSTVAELGAQSQEMCLGWRFWCV